MAANRTFQFYGIGYGTSNVSITANVNSTTVYSGTIPTTDRPITPPTYPTPEDQVILFTIPDSALLNTDFSGSLPMTVTVTGDEGAAAYFGWINSNYYFGNVQIDPNVGSADHYSSCYDGNPTNSEGTADPRSSVKINGVTQVPPSPVSLGCWNWYIPTGGTLTYNWNISIGQVGTTVGDTANYTPPV